MNKLLLAIILSVILAINYAHAVNVDCSSQNNYWVPFGIIKECLAYNVVSKEPSQALESVQSYEGLSDFKSFYIYQSPLCYFLPAGITEKFPNLEVLVVAHTGLRSITKDDLKPFTNLRGLYIDYSKITSIHGDLFINNRNLEELSLQQNGIKYVEADTFKSLRKLTSFSFNKNDCYDGKASGRDSVTDLLFNIEENCNIREFVRHKVQDQQKQIVRIEIETTTEVQKKQESDIQEESDYYPEYVEKNNIQDEMYPSSSETEQIQAQNKILDSRWSFYDDLSE